MQKWERILVAITLAVILALQLIIVFLLVKREPPAPVVNTPPVSLFAPPAHSPTPPALTPTATPAVEIPAPQSEGARVLKNFCAQCHALPSPTKHTAAEWSTLLTKKRTQIRATSGGGLFGGPSIKAPIEQEWKTLQAYLAKYAR